MLELSLQLLSFLLIIAGFFFILLESFVKFDRSFLFLGGALVLFGLVPAIDIWVLPESGRAESALPWIRIQHILTVLLLPLILWYLKKFLKSKTTYLHLVINVFVVFFSLVLFSDASLRVEDGSTVRGPLYNYLFLPCFAVTGCFISIMIANRLKGTEGNERRILFYHLIGFALLCAFGTIDLIVKSMYGSVTAVASSFFILGVLAFGLMTFLIFTERLLMLMNDRRRAYDHLRTALEEMQEASALRQIGESAAIINHEIKNYLTRIFGAAELLELTESLSSDGKQEIEAIKNTVAELQHFSMDILELSRARIVREKEMLTLVPLIRQCVGRHFPGCSGRIRISGGDESLTIRGEWDKLEHVFVNVIKNAFEADASIVDIRCIPAGSVILVSISDDGAGCPAEQLPSIFKAFYTTKKAGRGTGLGMSISRAVVESHGGRISAYTYNELGPGRHGIQIIISLPLYGESGHVTGTRSGRIALFREGLAEFTSLLAIFTNVNICPAIVQRAEELDRKKVGDIATLIVAEDALNRGLVPKAAKIPLVVPVFSKNGITYARRNIEGPEIEIFCEEYVLTRFSSAG
ncbi:MAG: HAMP domain-containing histidine kinase [Chitinispirillaceae bacterium]|nr:HAMP domain-containing histidine kinase [Chitinispirillaceae bacterium]